MDRVTDLFPASPTNSSTSSSDLDTMSTGSFFRDRSTTLGTLMGLASPEIPARPIRAASGRRAVSGGPEGVGGRKPKVKKTRCWRLCRGDVGPRSLEEFLRAERRLGPAEADFLFGNEVAAEVGGRLFLDGRVLPPAAAGSAVGRRRREGDAAGSLGRLPVMIAGICGGGDW